MLPYASIVSTREWSLVEMEVGAEVCLLVYMALLVL